MSIRHGPTISQPITSLQSNAFVVDHYKNTVPPKHYAQEDDSKTTHHAHRTTDKHTIKINTNFLHDQFHHLHGVFATIQAHNLWRDVNIMQGLNSLCTSCKIMTISATSRGKSRKSIVWATLDKIQVDTVPNPEPMGVSHDSQYNYFLILCDRYSWIFQICGIRDKSTDACIDGIELLLSTFPSSQRHLRYIWHICSDAGTEFCSNTFPK